ncbi:MAG: hypothetical protein ACT4PO_04085 [Actinomycetota bacterium]
MRRFGDVLELIHSSCRRFRTVRASGRTNERRWRLWWAGDDRFRFESPSGGARQITVRAGDVWWALGPDGEAHTNDGDPNLGIGMQPEFALLHTRSLLAASLLEIVRDQRVAGRPAVVLLARPRPGADWRWWGFWGSTDPIEVPIDLERGVALAGLRSRFDEVAFDEELPAGLFARPYAAGHRPVRSGIAQPREVSMEEARRAVDFPVLLPRVLPEGARLLRCLVDADDPPGWVGVFWAVDPGHRYAINLRQGPAVAREAAHFRSREIRREGRRLLVEEIGSDHYRSYTVLAERGSQWVEIHSELPLDAVIAIALSVEERP